MRKVIFGVANSLDNFIARRDGSYDWLMWTDEVAAYVAEFWQRIDAILMGRKTYDVTRQQAGSYEGPDLKIKTYVFSRMLKKVDDPNVELVSTDAAAFVLELKRQPGKDICVMGGGDLAQSLFEAGAIDEVGVNIHPILLGDGTPLFLPMHRQVNLALKETRPFKNGCVLLTYDVVHDQQDPR
jgi:dihydrofolate reductase